MRYNLILFLILLITTTVNGQEVILTKDLEAWSNIEINKKIKKRYELDIEHETRFNQSISAFRSSLFEIELARDCGKNLEIGVDSRYKLLKKDCYDKENRIRYGMFIRQKFFKEKLITVIGTAKYQREYHKTIKDYNTYWKFRLKLTADLKRGYSPYFSSEIVRTQELYETPYFDTYRMWLGTKKKLRRNSFSLALGYNQELNSKYPKSTWIFRLKYNIDFK
jgi:hypothetical protein